MPRMRIRSGLSPSSTMPMIAVISGMTPGSRTPAADAGVAFMPKPTTWKNGAPDPSTMKISGSFGVPFGHRPVRSQ
ncbi:hypothetical protein [Rhizobium sp. RU36D]|uniref:hypothetical protein n=1 Tax=Rhizobium sp. RU36D TaxID=1907415 RepID=UPI001FCDF9F2|nr:hypothetical protein [Rhizobium sp. RU36D]